MVAEIIKGIYEPKPSANRWFHFLVQFLRSLGLATIDGTLFWKPRVTAEPRMENLYRAKN